MAENPFPGMYPYLEQRWGDVHTRLIAYAADMLQDSLPADLRARMQERVFIEAEELPRRTIYPDVMVYEPPRGTRVVAASSNGGSIAVTEPILIHVEGAEVTEPFLEIIDAHSGGKVVTVLEFVSRSNKEPGEGRNSYLWKQKECREAGVNLVEIDLLRGGVPVTLAQPQFVPRSKHSPFHACAWRATDSIAVEYYPIWLRERLPKIRIPLRTADPDVVLDLQELINLCYTRGRYDDIDYSQPLDPPLHPEDMEWTRTLLKDTAGDR